MPGAEHSRKENMRQILLPLSLCLIAVTIVCPMNAQQIQVEEFVLENGMNFLLVPRRGDPNIAAGWIAKVGSANEYPGITGLSHLFEHMMFKGTKTIGTKNIAKDMEIILQLDRVKGELITEEERLIDRLRLGDISDLSSPENRSPRHQELLMEFGELLAVQEKLLVKNEFDRIYTRNGASGMNAGTAHDFTVYFINVPANKLELWCWLESDRLTNPVFREFYSERNVVYEERRLRTESTPTGRFREQFEALFWSSHPYGWPVVGWPSDLEGITRSEANAYFEINYSPNNLVGSLVGDFDTTAAKKLIRKYFGRLERNPRAPSPVRTREIQQLAEKRMIAYADTNPEIALRYHTVADGHVDEAPLVVLTALLTGRTGRLQKALVEVQQVANRTSAVQESRKWAGYFSVSGVAKQDRTPEEVGSAIRGELERLKGEPVGKRELQKVKNRFSADLFRRIESNFSLMVQLLIAETYRGWETLNTDPARIQAVSAQDIKRVAKKYFRPENSAVAIYYRKESGEVIEGEITAGGSVESSSPEE